jgi:hypothetical protein
MNGGTISGNKVNSTNGEGGGVYNDSVIFTMTGTSTISDNKAPNGGGVYVNSGTFDIQGGTISGNTAYGNNPDTADGNGGGVYVLSGTFTMNGGAIYGLDSDADDPLKNKAGTGSTYVINNHASTEETIHRYPE